MSKDLKIKVCSATFFVCVMVHVLLGYFLSLYYNTLEGYWFGFLLYIFVPLMPFILGLKKIHISFEITIVFLYFTICFVTYLATRGSANGPIHLWHPLWVMFLLIPIYHIFNRKTLGEKINDKVDEVKKENKQTRTTKTWSSGWSRKSNDDDTIDV